MMSHDERGRRSPSIKRITPVLQDAPAGTALPTAATLTKQPGSGALCVGGARLTEEATEGNLFRALGGSEASPAFNCTMLRQVLSAMRVPPGGDRDAEVSRAIQAAGAALKAFKPRDEIEGMIAAQAVAMHFQAMECLRRAMLPEQLPEIASKLRRDGANLVRAMTDMVEALSRKRGKGPKIVRVERVIVQEGANAIVGNVSGVAAGDPAVGQRVKVGRQ